VSEPQTVNDNLVLICGTSAGGKSASLRKLKKQEGVMYLNAESGKKLPFANKFARYTITDPYQVLQAFDHVQSNNGTITHPQLNKPVEIHTIVIDSLTFLMDMFESLYVIPAVNTMQAWGSYQQFFKSLMQEKVASSPCNVLFTAHTLATLNENEGILEVKIPIKGALKNNGIEAYFSCVVAAKKVPIKKLEGYGSDLLEITEEDATLGYKYVFQTKLTKDTVNERIRGPMGLFTTAQTFMDNDAQKLLDHLHAYYNGNDSE
jgi:hypothetical protein